MRSRLITILALIAVLLAGVASPDAGYASDSLELTIMEIQGDGLESPYKWQKVTTSGVVTLHTPDRFSFWIQDPVGDGNPATSDGLYVFGGGTKAQVSVGDFVVVTDKVSEYTSSSGPKDQPLTEFAFPYSVEILSSGNPLPDPVELTDLPDESITDGIWFWEPLEGMLVSVENGFVVAATSRYGEFGMLTETDADAELMSGYYAQTKQILIRSLGDDVVDYNPERILVDDSSLDDPIIVMPGDRVRSLVGVVDYTYGNYKLQPASFDVKNHDLPNLPASTRSGPNGNTVITTFNVENLFDLVLNTPTTIDVFGQIEYRPSDGGWGFGTQTYTKDNTLRRKDTICQGDPNGTDTFDPAVEWDGFGKNVFDGLGSHTVSCGDTSELFISEYVEGSSYNKALEIYNGTGSPVHLGPDGYTIDVYFNGKDYAGTSIQLSGTVMPGDVYVLADERAAAGVLEEADQTTRKNLFNGDDTIVLRKGGKDDASSTPTPEELETQLAKLTMAIEVELRLPEIIVVQEIENQVIAQELADRINVATGTSYVATSFETSDGRGIEPGFLWDAARVTLLEAFRMSGPGVEQWFGPGSPSAGREPIVGIFDIEGQVVTIIGNHFKSKGGDDPLYGVNWPPYRVTEIQRKGQARVVRDFANGILDADSSALVMVTGDLNDFQFGEPDENLIGNELGHPLSILEGGAGEVPLTNLLNFEKLAETYTYVYDGNSQVLDHMLVSPALLEMYVAADILHFNAGFPSDLGEDSTTTLRASDHDALEGRFKIK